MCSVIVGNIAISVLIILLYLVYYGVELYYVDNSNKTEYLLSIFLALCINIAIILCISLGFLLFNDLSGKDSLLLKYIQLVANVVYILSLVAFQISIHRFKKDSKLYQKIAEYFDVDLEELVDDFVDLDSRNNKVVREKFKRLRKLLKMSKYFDTLEARQEFLNDIVEKEIDKFIRQMDERSAEIQKENEEKHNQTLIKDKELLKQFKEIYDED